jgi:hypothetical protein
LFHSLVVCGASFALVHCGGRSRTDGDHDDDGGSTGTSGGTSGGAGAAAGSGGTPGNAGTSAGGATSGGTAAGGATAGGGASGGSPFEQWECSYERLSSSEPEFGSVAPYVIELPCVADSSRPTSPDDCLPGQQFSCLVGIYSGSTVHFNCECLPPGDAGTCTCPVLDGGCLLPTVLTCEVELTECGATYTCILR